ncbi:MAG: OmpA family protein [Sphingobacteriales bacterium]|nr:MAG: OmpA family protein [Sphingobacteriales bacterium]
MGILPLFNIVVSLPCTTYLCSTILRSLFVLSAILSGGKLTAQNLLDNAGFEDINICTEYHATCAPESWFYMRPASNPMVNGRLAPKPLLGNNFLLLPMHDVSKRIRPLVYTMLLCPLQKGKDYKLSFYLYTANRKFYNIDVAFLKKEPVTKDFDPYALIPNFKINESDIVSEVKGWSAVEYLFTATENSRFMLIGNINSTAQMKYSQADGMNKAGMVYYFVDEIVLRPLQAQQPCKEITENKRKLWSQDLRHTEYVVVDNEPATDTPKIIIDTLVLPAVLFKTNSAIIDKKFESILDSMVNKLSQKNIQSMQIIGHTDNKGKYENNVVLSQNRAAAVKQYLSAKLLVSDIGSEGKADTVPVTDNNTEIGRSKNRRVEIIISYLQ